MRWSMRGSRPPAWDLGLPVVWQRGDLRYVKAADEHGVIATADARALSLGDTLMLVPGHCDPTVNLYDELRVRCAATGSKPCGRSPRAARCSEARTAMPTQHFDLLIRNASIVDGTGALSFGGDVGVRSDRIARIGDLASASAALDIDAAGRVVAPGFIDAHTHDDRLVLAAAA